MLKKALSQKQGDNRLMKYSDLMEDIDNWGFHPNIEHETKVIWDMEKDGRRIHLTIDLKTGIISEVER